MIREDDLQFEGLKLLQDEKGYAFTCDSVFLANFVKVKKQSKIVEFCSGTGVISVLLSKKQNPKKIVAFEIQKPAYDLFVKSVKLNKLESIVFPVNERLENCINVLGYEWADAVVCNPPYLPKKEEKDNYSIKEISVSEIETNLESVVKNSFDILKYGGKLFMVHRCDRIVDVLSCLRNYKLEPKVIEIIYPKKDYEPVVFLVEATKGGKPGVRFKSFLAS